MHTSHVCCIFGNTCIAFGRYCCLLLLYLCGRCYNHKVGVVACCFTSGRCCDHQANVIACCFYLCLADVLPCFVLADVIATVCDYGYFRMVDVIAKVADVATDCNCCNFGRCYCQGG